MKRFVKFIVVTIALFCFACTKSDEPLPKDSLELNDTFWRIENVEVVENETMANDGYNGEEYPYLYIQHDSHIMFVGLIWNNRYDYSYKSYEYNPSDKILTVGDIVYELLEFSEDRIEMRYSEKSQTGTISKTMTLIPWSDNDKTWEEWVEYIDSM